MCPCTLQSSHSQVAAQLQAVLSSYSQLEAYSSEQILRRCSWSDYTAIVFKLLVIRFAKTQSIQSSLQGEVTRMDMYEKLSRALMRRKYEKVDVSGRFQVKTKKPVTMRVPKAEKGKNVVREEDTLEPLPVLVPKRFTILSSSNDVIDQDWLEQALRRTLAEGRLNLVKPSPSDE